MSKSKILAWDSVDWPLAQSRVLRIQRRIHKAQTLGNKKRVHWLQHHLLRSLDAKLIAVRRVTTLNKGRKTAGVDKQIVTTAWEKERMVFNLALNNKANPIRRVWIDKPGKAEKRPLGIPTIQDRAKQSLALLALEPQWEAKLEPNSYGFRPGRSAHDAIEAIFSALSHKRPKYLLDADIRKCFDRINHTYLLEKLDTFPEMKSQISAWLKAGIMEVYANTPKLEQPEMGTPQGGIIFPLLANTALHGLEIYLKDFIATQKQIQPRGSVTTRRKTLSIIRYADDFVVIHENRDIIEMCVTKTQQWLAKAGLELSQEKSQIRDTRQSFLFLGFQIAHVMKNKEYKVKIIASTKNRFNYQQKVGKITLNHRSSTAYASLC